MKYQKSHKFSNYNMTYTGLSKIKNKKAEVSWPDNLILIRTYFYILNNNNTIKYKKYTLDVIEIP